MTDGTLTLKLAPWAEAALDVLPKLVRAGIISPEEIDDTVEAIVDAAVEVVEDE